MEDVNIGRQREPGSAAAPLLVGVTGHRDLRPDDRAPLSCAVRDVLEELRHNYPDTPILLLSPLAEGADRLVAEVARSMDIQLVATLPLPASLYEVDFKTPESIAEFRTHLAAAQLSFSLPLLAPEAEVSREGDARDAQYEEAGKYIVRQCQILLALWDAEDNGKRGGTAQIVRYQLEGLPSEDCRLEPLELFPVYHIPSPRLENPSPKVQPFRLRKLYPSGLSPESADAEAYKAAQEYYDRIFRNLDEYNRDATRPDPILETEAKRGRSYVVEQSVEAALPGAARLTLGRFGITDALARRFQRRTVQLQLALHWLVFGAFTFFVLFAHLPEEYRSGGLRLDLLFASVVLLAASLAVHRYAKHWRVESKYLDYRAVTEGLRVKFFWQIAGIREPVGNLYLRKLRTELDWIRNGFRGWDLGEPASAVLTNDSVRLLKTNWVEDQFNYFGKKAEENERNAEWFERSALAFMVFAIFGLGSSFFTRLNPFWSDINNILIDVCLAIGALLHHYGNQMAFAEHQKQYARMRVAFGSASDFLAQELARDSDDGMCAGACILKLGREALAENGDWVLLHRERPLELPHA